MFCCRILAPNLGRGQHKIIFTIIIILFALLIFLGYVTIIHEIYVGKG